MKNKKKFMLALKSAAATNRNMCVNIYVYVHKTIVELLKVIQSIILKQEGWSRLSDSK